MTEINYTSTFPFRTCDIDLPDDPTGYLYILLSTKDTNRTYIGQCTRLKTRLNAHNKGGGSKGTRMLKYRPYCMAGYITGMTPNITKKQREGYELKWNQMCNELIRKQDFSIISRIKQGERIVSEYNASVMPEDYWVFIRTIEETAL